MSVRAVDNVGNTSLPGLSGGVTVAVDSSFLAGNVGTFTDTDDDKQTVRLTPANVGKIAVLQYAPLSAARGRSRGSCWRTPIQPGAS
ncbi:hypothetical protein [Zavarzinella formosa]|uniref:hypothetical protein n=1 Tax=Zavarzinella formosa TaxID=360055 RepID=UPI000310E9F9|nr:hypothetical protein [Zavarzinella formosa]